jgi:N-methylhydantoinase A/acetone carboxylase, beta subunit
MECSSKMAYDLGIDAGGTYTDSVLIRKSDGKVVCSNKALTTYPDPIKGIEKSIDGLDTEKLKLVTVVSVSTTLATNTILEGTGYPVGLILIGNYDVPEDSGIENWIMRESRSTRQAGISLTHSICARLQTATRTENGPRL